MTPEIVALIERIMTFEPKIRSEWDWLPMRAREHYLDAMIIDEIQATNEIEQVRSTRKEVSAALDALAGDRSAGSKRFVEMVRLYLDIDSPNTRGPQTLADVRAIYDAVTAGEIAEKDLPDGVRFRGGTVSIESGTKVVHTGLVPESAIDDALTLMLSQRRDDSVSMLLRAVVAHFIFEYAHPFYDGNGRTGRYLLALDLREVLAPYASLSLSATIADSKDRYYRAFSDVEDPLNRGDLTPFLIVMLDLIAQAQSRLLTDLAGRRGEMAKLADRLGDLVDGGVLSDLGTGVDPDDVSAILYTIGQAWLFDANRAVKLQSVADSIGRSPKYVRPRLAALNDAGVIETVTRKPLRFRLSARGVELLGLDSLSG
ncbi:Fic family protein [Gordonia spumicola]|nr:Fic family protein [Gordonia spumicola]